MTDDTNADDAPENDNDAPDGAEEEQPQGSDEGQDDAGEEKKVDNPSIMDAADEVDEFDFTTGEQPEGFPDEYWDSENNAPDTQKLYDAVKKNEKIASDLRKKMGSGDHKPPKEAGEYDFEISEDVKELVPDDDPMVAAAKEVALEAGLSKDQFANFVPQIIEKMVEIAQNNTELTPEQKKEYVDAEIAKLGDSGKRIIRANNSWIKTMESQGQITKEAAEELRGAMDSADRVKAFNQIRALISSGDDIPIDGVDDGLPPDAEIADMIDKAYASKDPKKINKAEEMLNRRREAGRPERLQF